jgi:hypothetical protein
MDIEQEMIDAFESWFDGLPVHKPSGGPAKGTMCAALVVLERLKKDFDLDLDKHRAKGGSQIKGTSGAAVRKILSRHGESRPFSKEGGRTNRGVPGDIKKMLETLEGVKLDRVDDLEVRDAILNKLQQFITTKVTECLNRGQIKMVFDQNRSSWQVVRDLLDLAREMGKEGPVAQHLVGAKLQLRFPEMPISNESYSTADDQLGRPGDFYIGDTAFHVTVSPMPLLYEKCKNNLDKGLRVYLLVPDRSLHGTRQNTELLMAGKIAVESIESFVSQNIEEISVFSKSQLTSGFRNLIKTYNERVDASEIDKSFLIEIPDNL